MRARAKVAIPIVRLSWWLLVLGVASAIAYAAKMAAFVARSRIRKLVEDEDDEDEDSR